MNAEHVDASIGVVRGAATADANIAEPGLAFIIGPAANRNAVLAEPARLDPFNAHMLEMFASGKSIKNQYAAVSIGPAILAFDDEIADDDATRIPDLDASSIAGADRCFSFSI